ncbi:DUF2635 domain-containing protein [Sphingomonas sp. AOB5]|uniref:DUF2635 domain-containing protein n=1 Tax=Sphingomonas sp. AOB5 TaxID=3034017 RepID=UPI0023F6D82B|nr:DUF2635 domain-containing protein [Sphingomonas sp. AOB5]MDF7776869.1 DUF2635 domain-containing protein [Sphingomonas sp. AOB5]
MTDRRFIKPAEGRDVRDPAAGNALVPPHGKGVPWDSFWQRRLDDGDIEMTSEAAVLKGERAADGDAGVESDAADTASKGSKAK